MDDDKALKNKQENEATNLPELNDLSRRLREDYIFDVTAHDQYVLEFDAYEAMLMSMVYDSVSRETRSGITDGMTTTLAVEAAYRVVGQLPSGEVKAAGKNDTGKSVLLDIIRQKYIYPNANAQHPFLDKVRMWEFYKRVYGYMPMFVDWNISPTGYIGPDCWLWSPRNFIPQNGQTSIADMDYCHTISFVIASYFEEILERAVRKVPVEEGE